MYVGVDIGATKTLLATKEAGGSFIEQEKFSTPANFTDFYGQLDHLINSKLELNKIKGLAVAVPGVIEAGRLRRGGQIAWQDIDLNSELERLFKLTPTVINDAEAAGLYEARSGAGQAASPLLYVTISTGIGTAIVIDQKLNDNFRNSEGGQMLLDWSQKITFEQLASGDAFVQRFGHLGSEEHDLAVWQEYGCLVGTGLFSMITLLRPEMVVIGGSMGVHLPHYLEPLEQTLRSLVNDLFKLPPVVAASHPETAVARGCLTLAETADA